MTNHDFKQTATIGKLNKYQCTKCLLEVVSTQEAINERQAECVK